MKHHNLVDCGVTEADSFNPQCHVAGTLQISDPQFNLVDHGVGWDGMT